MIFYKSAIFGFLMSVSPVFAGGMPGTTATEWTQIANNIELGTLVAKETASLGKLSSLLSIEMQEIATLTSTYQTILQNSQNLDASFLRDSMEPVKRLRDALEQSGALARDAKEIDNFLRSDLITDPLFKKEVLESSNLSTRYDAWSNQWGKTLSSNLRAAGLTMEDVQSEGEFLTSLNSKLGSEGGQLQALQLSNQIAVSVARQMNDLRSLTALQIEQNGVAWARVFAETDSQKAAERKTQQNLDIFKKSLDTTPHRSINEILELNLN